jgi:recombination protein RecA
MYNEGISKVGDILDLGVELELIDRRGSYYSYGETRLGQGRENTKEYLQENPDLAEEIELEIRSAASVLPEVDRDHPEVTREDDREESEQAESVLEAA